MTDHTRPAGSAPPNILLITSDQQHYSTLGVENPRISTPSLNGLCSDGTRFTRAYCPSPVCSPSRASIITGQYPSQHGCWTIGVKLDEEIPTLGSALGAAGYDTTLIGKAHFQPLATDPAGGQTSIECQPVLRDLEFWRGFHGPWYGFNHVELARNHADESHVGQHYALWLEEQGLKNWRDFFEPWPPDVAAPKRKHRWDLPEELHYTTWTAERSIAAIDRSRNKEQPFFLWSSFHDPHPPYLVPQPWATMYDAADMELGTLAPHEFDRMPPQYALTQEPHPDFSPWQETPYASHGFHSHLRDPEGARADVAVYYGMISFMDQQIGRILAHLQQTGLAENTLVVFTTDHGHFLGQHGLYAKGAFLYEDLLRLPFIVRWPGRVPAGSVSSSLQNLVDLAPTFLAACGQQVPGMMQGINQLPVWRGDAASAREVSITEFRHQPTAIHIRTYVTERSKLTIYRDRDYGELFDLEQDPQERNNLWLDPAGAALRAEMMQRALNAEIAREPMRFPRIAVA